MDFGNRLRLMRAYRKVTQTDLEERTGIDQTVLSRIEAGAVLPNATLRKAICEALGWDEQTEKGLDMIEAVASDLQTAGKG